MYNCEDMHITAAGRVYIRLVKKTDDDTFGGRIHRYNLKNKEVGTLLASVLDYKRRGEYLVGTIVLPKSDFTKIGSFVFEDWLSTGIKGNVRGCY